MAVPVPALSKDELIALLRAQFPNVHEGSFRIDQVDAHSLRLWRKVDERSLRPGGTVSGPTLMTVADTATYFLILARLGPQLMAVTSSLNIHFLRRPRLAPVVADATLLKLGKRLAVADVKLFSEGDTEPVAVASVSYSLPTM